MYEDPKIVTSEWPNSPASNKKECIIYDATSVCVIVHNQSPPMCMGPVDSWLIRSYVKAGALQTFNLKHINVHLLANL